MKAWSRKPIRETGVAMNRNEDDLFNVLSCWGEQKKAR